MDLILATQLRFLIFSPGLEAQLKNLVLHELGRQASYCYKPLTFPQLQRFFVSLCRLYHSQRTLPLLSGSQVTPEPLVFLRQAQEEWEGRIRRQVNTMVTQLGEPLAKEVR